ncbi:MAG: MerR family transcriptional regulator [Deltaproteobacteria bacterium]|nr:MerR family transcriptional regulator [Deltaproteobacteria bacterium]
MAYSLSEVVQHSGVPVDTIRYYQTIRLLPGPAREGRNAVYDDAHLDRLRLIRSMASRGFSLRVIAMLLEKGERTESDRALLTAIEEESTEPGYDSAAAATQLGVPHALLASVERAGLAEAQEQADGSRRYSEGDLRVARGALKILGYGFPLTRLLALAVKHDRSIRKTVDGAIDLFDQYVRKRTRGSEADPEAVGAAFKDILPLVTALVAHHFQRVLVNRALKRLKKSGERGPLEVALKVASATRLGVRWQ